MLRIAKVLLMVALCVIIGTTFIQAEPPIIDGCEIFPDNNAWNTDISDAPVHPLSDTYIANINSNGGDFVHPDFGEDPSYGIPWTTVDGSQPLVPVDFDYADESDPGPYPIPPDAPVEGGGDRHVLVVETTNCVLYELYAAEFQGGPDNAWYAGSGAVFDLASNDLRPDGWTSADAAGLPILPGLARCEEAELGTITHALRFTVSRTQKAYIYPATHFASSYTDPAYPPMGLRFRLKANYNINDLTGQALAVAQALKTYGMILADNGSNWYISGETNPGCWNDDELNQLKDIPGTAFEVVISPPPPAEPGELLQNAGFEGADGKQALAWKVKNATGEKRVCNRESALDGIYKQVAYAGHCAYKFKGSAGESSKLQQKIDAVLASGTNLVMSAQITGKNIPGTGGTLTLKAKYGDDTKDKFTLPFNGGTYDYTEISAANVLNGSPVKLKFTIAYTETSGKLTIDDVSLQEEVIIPPTDEPTTEPTATETIESTPTETETPVEIPTETPVVRLENRNG